MEKSGFNLDDLLSKASEKKINLIVDKSKEIGNAQDWAWTVTENDSKTWNRQSWTSK